VSSFLITLLGLLFGQQQQNHAAIVLTLPAFRALLIESIIS
jgi:uncharacterized membrane protein